MTYKLTTKEEILDGEDRSYAPPPEGMRCGQCGVDWSKLMAERNVYRDIAMRLKAIWPQAVAEREVDAEAARIMEKESKK